jgi:mannose-6-phosphate isomerase-like protein (cupin superfamily)
MKFPFKSTQTFERKGVKVRVYNSRDDFSNLSAALLEVTGRHGKIKTMSSDRVYFIVEGKGEFTVGDTVTSVGPNDVVIVPKGTPYDFKGHMRVFMVHAPAFDAQSEVDLESH